MCVCMYIYIYCIIIYVIIYIYIYNDIFMSIYYKSSELFPHIKVHAVEEFPYRIL